jgi:hypothetical protein
MEMSHGMYKHEMEREREAKSLQKFWSLWLHVGFLVLDTVELAEGGMFWGTLSLMENLNKIKEWIIKSMIDGTHEENKKCQNIWSYK